MGVEYSSKEARKLIKNTSKQEKYHAWNLKRSLGQRELYLAYGYLRNVPYKSIEKKCNEPPDIDKICRHLGFSSRVNSCNKVKDWLDPDQVPENETWRDRLARWEARKNG